MIIVCVANVSKSQKSSKFKSKPDKLTSTLFLSMPKIDQEKAAEKFCNETSGVFYRQYFIMIVAFIIASVLTIIGVQSDLATQLLGMCILSVIIDLILLPILPLWMKKILTFPVLDRDLSSDIRIKMNRLIRKRESMRKLRKYISLPFLITLPLSIVCIVIVFIAFPTKDERKTTLSIILFFMCLLLPVVCIIIWLAGFFWQLPYIISSLWQLFIANWYNNSYYKK